MNGFRGWYGDNVVDAGVGFVTDIGRFEVQMALVQGLQRMCIGALASYFCMISIDHCEMFRLMGTGKDSVMIIHMGVRSPLLSLSS